LPITISASPTADFNIGPSCLNKPTVFTNTSSPGISSSNWIINGNNYSTLNPTHTFTNAGGYTASLTVKGSNLCENTIVKPIDVKPVPILNFNTTALCATKETTFTDQSTGSDLPVSWHWNFGSGNTSVGSPTTYSFPSVGSFPVDMSVTTQAGCGYSFSRIVQVATPPVASFTNTTSFGPPPLLVQFNSSSTNASSLLWNFNDAAASTSSIPNPLFTFGQLGDYDVELTAFNSIGCSDTFSKTINVLIPSIDLSINDLKVQPGLTGTSIIPVLVISNNSNVFISSLNVAINGSSGSILATDLQVNLMPGASSEFVVPFELRSNEKYLCAELSVVSDIDAKNNAKCLNLSNQTIIVQPYPNPTNGTIFFEAVLSEGGTGSLLIMNSQGEIVFKNDFPNLAVGMNQLKLDLSNHKPGLYLATWLVNDQKSEVKFIIQ
jgi:PKD repeat protein